MKLRDPKDIILKDGSTLQSRLDSGKLYLRGEDLSYANLDMANLDMANLDMANLDMANLDRANLDMANLDMANLYRANLDRANLNGASLNRANLDRANLYRANLNGANLNGASLNGASLNMASLYGASLNRASLDGSVYGYKGITAKIWYPFSGMYRYITIPMIADDGTQYVRMGCFIRTRTKWENDFWNNDNEFPNDGSLDSMRRLWAFEFACKWLDAKAKVVNS